MADAPHVADPTVVLLLGSDTRPASEPIDDGGGPPVVGMPTRAALGGRRPNEGNESGGSGGPLIDRPGVGATLHGSK